MIQCKINGIVYKLKALISKGDKQVGLKAYPVLPRGRGVMFIYDHDINSKFDFSEIGYQCRIIFLDANCSVLHHEVTYQYQEELIVCPDLYRYVIEVGRYWYVRDYCYSYL